MVIFFEMRMLKEFYHFYTIVGLFLSIYMRVHFPMYIHLHFAYTPDRTCRRTQRVTSCMRGRHV